MGSSCQQHQQHQEEKEEEEVIIAHDHNDVDHPASSKRQAWSFCALRRSEQSRRASDTGVLLFYFIALLSE